MINIYNKCINIYVNIYIKAKLMKKCIRTEMVYTFTC